LGAGPLRRGAIDPVYRSPQRKEDPKCVQKCPSSSSPSATKASGSSRASSGLTTARRTDFLVRPGADGRASQSDQVIVLARLAGLAEHISLLIERDDRISAIWSGNGAHERAVDHGSTSSCSISPTCHYTRSRPSRAGPLLRAGRSPGRQQSTPFRPSADRVASPFENGER
jgi:hypothetical protein